MVSQEKLEKYCNSAKELHNLFWLNLEIAKTELVVKNSPVDFDVHKLICDTYEGIISARFFISRFELLATLKDRSSDECKKGNEVVEKFRQLEEVFDTQTQVLETLRSKPKAHASE